MQTPSQNFPRTFNKLAGPWTSKAGKRTSKDAIWTTTSAKKNEPTSMIPAMMTAKMGSISDMVEELLLLGGVRHLDQVWIYDMRSDGLPKSPADRQRLYAFMEAAVRKWFSQSEQAYIMKNAHIAACFLVWYFTKPNFFHKDKVMKQTTRHGIQRVWTCILTDKEPPKVVVEPPAPKTAFKRQPTTTTDALLPKQLAQQETIKTTINRMVHDAYVSSGERPKTIEWDDQTGLRIKMSELVRNDDRLFSENQRKKLQNNYNDYTKITEKINETMRKRARSDFNNSKIVNHTQPPGGEPALSPASGGAAEEPVEAGFGDEAVEAVSTCLQNPDDEVVDSWEDL